MSVKCYDDAIIKRFRQVFNNDSIYILPVENAIRFSAQLSNTDTVKFPLISTTRLGYSIRTSDVNFAQKMTGPLVRRDGEKNIFAQSIPIRIEYQMDIFTVDRQSCDEIVRELIFFMMQKPTLVAHFDYGLNIEQNFTLLLNDDIVDNSDTVEHINTGVMFRNTLTFYTDDARLFRSKKTLQGKVEASVEIIGENHKQGDEVQ